MAPVKIGDYNPPTAETLQELKDCANRMRINSIKATCASKSGHPTSCASAADIVSALFFHAMNHDLTNPRDANSDRFVMSKGHAAPLLYAAWVEAGHLKADELMNLRKIDCRLEGHPMPRLDFVDVATGSLGQGLSCAAGMAYTGKNFDKGSYRVYCLIGDGESAEGSIWEAAAFASEYKLDNLVAIFDVNRLGQSRDTALGHDLDVYKARMESMGWHAVVVDGHDMAAVCGALFDAKNARGSGKPVAIIAKTFKGQGIPNIANEENWHGKPMPADKAEAAIAALTAEIKNKDGPVKSCPSTPVQDVKAVSSIDNFSISLSCPPAYNLGDKVATRAAYGTSLVKIGQNCDRVVALDGDVSNSTMSANFRKQFPERYIECFIAEQNMVGVGIGCATRQRTIPFCSTFATFFSRAYDQLRMGAISECNLKVCGSHVGVSIGEDGPSQMGLEDLAMFRALPKCTVFYPSDAVSCERAVELAARTDGMAFIRTGRPAQPVIYANDKEFKVGQGNLVRDGDKAAIIAAGITLTEAQKAAEVLKGEGVEVAIFDPFTIKPIDKDGIQSIVKQCGGRVVIVEDHYYEGGLGDAVNQALYNIGIALKQAHLAVDRVPRSGPPDALLDMFGISSPHIVKAVKGLL